MKALITGGAGFIGSHLGELLLQNGNQVIALDDLSTGRRENLTQLSTYPGFSFVEGSVLDAPLVSELVAQSDVVFHLAAAVGVKLIMEKPVLSIETNVLGTHSVLRAATKFHRKVLLASTSEVYGKGTSVPFGEGDDRLIGPTTKSRWNYATTKALDEFWGLAYHAEHDLPVVILRFFNTVGPRQRGRYGMVIPRFVQQALANEPLTVYGDGTQTRAFCDVSDVVQAVAQLAETPDAVGDVFNIGNPEEISIGELAERIIGLSGSASVVQKIPYDRVYGEGFQDMQRRVPDVTKINRVIGWQPTIPLDEILRRVINFYREQKSVG